MRISDWSSDVCSSDLLALYLLVEVGEQRREGPFRRHWNTTFHGLSSATCALFITAPFASAVSTLETTLLVFAGSTSRLLAREVVMARYRSEEHTSELQSLMRNSDAVICFNKKSKNL